MFKCILNRLTERLTWLGVIGLITACGATLEIALAEQIIAAGMAVASLVGILTKDKSDDNEEGGSRG